jgi:hypothetical protein
MPIQKYLPETLKGWLFDLQHLGQIPAPYPDPIFILGNQKSGTSVVSALLAELTGVSFTLDLTRERFIPTYPQVIRGERSIAQFIQTNRAEFGSQIIKEPNLSLLYQPLAQAYPQSRFLMVIRDPRDNLRSILDRLKLPGDLPDLTAADWAKLTPAWRLILQNSWLGTGNTNDHTNDYIGQSAKRWQVIAQSYLQHRDQIHLIRYEDFLKDKRGAITALARHFNLPTPNNIDSKLNVQYQPAGNRNVNWQDFFGATNLAKIEQICAPEMQELGYALGVTAPQ